MAPASAAPLEGEWWKPPQSGLWALSTQPGCRRWTEVAWKHCHSLVRVSPLPRPCPATKKEQTWGE